MKDLIKNCLAGRNQYSPLDNFDNFDNDEGMTRVFKVESDSFKLLYWNSSNNEEPSHDYVLSEIAILLLNGEMNNSLSVDFNEIMFEVIEK